MKQVSAKTSRSILSHSKAFLQLNTNHNSKEEQRQMQNVSVKITLQLSPPHN